LAPECVFIFGTGSAILQELTARIGDTSPVNASFRFLEPGEGQILSDAIRAAYGDTYDLAWVYDS